MKSEYVTTAPLYLHFHDVEEELDAVWVIEVETYPAEPTSWGQSRGTETEVGARLLSWHRHGDTFTRADAEAIEGEARIIEQEEWVATDADHQQYGMAAE